MRRPAARPVFEPLDREELARRADRELAASFEQKYFVRASARGEFPGSQMLDAIYRVRGELGAPHLPFLPLLSQRGYAATQLARTLCCLEGLTADGTASGWRVRQGRSEELERARSLFSSDINALADVVGGEKAALAAPYHLSLMGPISLAASVYLSNGELLLADPGARRDLLQSFVEGLQVQLDALEEASQGAPLILQLEEPLLGQALAGSIPTSSGYRTHRHLPRQEAEAALAALHRELSSRVEGLVYRLEPDLPFELFSSMDGVALSLEGSDVSTWEMCARLLEADKQLWLGLQNPAHFAPVAERAGWFLKNWRTVGLPLERLGQVTITETAGLDALTPDRATRVLEHLTEVARAVAELASE